jgi:hypothetical protein
MDSKRLSQRTVQPGHDRTFVRSETNFIKAATECLDPTKYAVEPKPRELLRIFGDGLGRDLGVEPEAAITSLATGRKFFVEVKKQGDQGNADERACKHHTVQFYKTLATIYPDYGYHPFVTILCESLATNRRYTLKAKYYFEPDNYFLWANYDLDALCEYLHGRCRAWLDVAPRP